jgi:hypothetical protein
MPKSAPPFSLPQALLHAFDTNDRINQYMIENRAAGAWRVALARRQRDLDFYLDTRLRSREAAYKNTARGVSPGVCSAT